MTPEQRFEQDLPTIKRLFEGMRLEARAVCRASLDAHGIRNARGRRVEAAVSGLLDPPSRIDLWEVFVDIPRGARSEADKLRRIMEHVQAEAIATYLAAIRREGTPEDTMAAIEGWIRPRMQQIVTENLDCL